MLRKSILAIAACLLLAAAAFLVLLPRLNLARFAAARATSALGRQVTIAGLHVTPGRWLAVSLDHATLADLPGGKQADMATLGHASAEIEALSLLRGPMTLRRLRIDGMSILLEHRPDGTRNWKGGLERAKPAGPADRSRDPTILDATLHALAITYRGSSGTELRTVLDQVSLSAKAADQKVTLAASGTYNAAPVSLSATLGSFDALRDAARPFATDAHLASRDTRLHFQGTMTDPLNVEGADGTATLQAPDPSQLIELAGAAGTSIPPITLAGPFAHKGGRWAFTGASGMLKTMPFTARTLALAEGADGKPDQVTADIAFDALDLGFLDIPAKTPKRTPADISLSVDRTPGALIDAKLAATSLTYAGLVFNDAKLDASLTPGQIELHALSLGYLGATGTATAKIDAEGAGGRITLDANLAGIDVQRLGQSMGLKQPQLTGRLAARLSATAAGNTVRDATQAKQIAAVLTMAGGTIPRRIVELVSTDVRTLFRRAPGAAAMSCALAVVTIQGNAGRLSPLRIRSGPGTIGGAGTFDLARRTLDVVVGSKAATTGAFALNIPMRISGSFQDPTIVPAGRTVLGAIPALPASLAAVARASACASR